MVRESISDLKQLNINIKASIQDQIYEIGGQDEGDDSNSAGFSPKDRLFENIKNISNEETLKIAKQRIKKQQFLFFDKPRRKSFSDLVSE